MSQVGLDIVVCVKQVPDPEGPSSSFTVDEENVRVVTSGIPPVVSPFDENALEAALRLKEAGGGRITLLSAGTKISNPVMLKALATGADNLVLVQDGSLDYSGTDSRSTAALLAAAIGRMDAYDLVLTGRQAADTNAGQVGVGIAGFLGIGVITLAGKIDVAGDKVVVQRVLPDGYEVVEGPLPLLVTVSHEVGDLRYPHLAEIKRAKEIPVTRWTAEELGVDVVGEKVAELVGISAPRISRRCELVEGETQREAGENLARALRRDGVL